MKIVPVKKKKMENKKRLVGVVLTAIMVIYVFVALAVPVSAAEENITMLVEIQKAIDEKGAKWTAHLFLGFLLKRRRCFVAQRGVRYQKMLSK
jgi:hypothetical protein